jgi:hypothetical protein
MLDLAEIKSRINPAYADRRGTESHERKILCDEIERLRAENEKLAGEFVEYCRMIAEQDKKAHAEFKAELDELQTDAERWRDLVSHQKFNNSKQVGYAINRSKERVAAMKGGE